MTMRSPAVRFKKVTKCYGSIRAVNNLELTIDSGVTALLGPNGAGKTTTLKMLIGILEPSAGKVELLGKDPTVYANRRRLGTMLQTIGAPDTLEVGELIQLYSCYYDAPLTLNDVVERANLRGLERRSFGRLSGGQARRVAFALAICGNPDVLVLDEPSAGLDLESRHHLWQHIREFASLDCKIILSTHHLEEADALSDRIVVMDKGKIIADGTPEQIKQVQGKQVRCNTSIPIEMIRTFTGVSQVEELGKTVAIRCQQVEPLVRFLIARDPGLSNLEVTNVSLEEAFIELTQASTPGEAI